MELLDMLRDYFERVRSTSDFLSFLTELRSNNISYYIYFVSTGNVKFVTTTDAFVSMKSDQTILRVNSETCASKVRLAARRHFTGVTTYDQYCRELARAGVFKWVVDLNDNTRQYWSQNNTILHVEDVIQPR